MFGGRKSEDVVVGTTTTRAIMGLPMDTTSQEVHQAQILADFQNAVRTNDQAERVLRDAERMASQAALALVEARKRMRRVTDGVV